MTPLLLVIALVAATALCARGADEAPDPWRGRPRTSERRAERERLADLLAARGIRDERVLAAIRAVPRHWFVPRAVAAEAYDDCALPLGNGQTISQPYIVALMTEALALGPRARVLEIGTGSAYQAAVLSEIAAEVFTIEIVPALAESSRELLERLGYANVACREGDGARGWPDVAPFDAVIVTAAPPRIAPAWIDELVPGGRLCVPIGPEGGDQELLLVEKRRDGSLAQAVLAPVRFVPLTGSGGSASVGVASPGS